jgi:hypothetical protein
MQVIKTLLTEGDRFQVFALVRNQEQAAKALGKPLLLVIHFLNAGDFTHICSQFYGAN